MSSSSSSSSPEITTATNSNSQVASYKYSSQREVLDDLSSRFILNLPDEELNSIERVCFQVEQAHWYYEDFIRDGNPQFPSLPLRKFSEMLFHACPPLHQWRHDHDQAFNTFLQYKTMVPVCGAIMLNQTWDKCVLVKGWKASSGWGFPKGKINESEPQHLCAVREVLEETGYNLANQIIADNVITIEVRDQIVSLYIVPGVPEDYPFETKTRKEISKIEWFRLTDLPGWKRNKTVSGKFYLINPFIAPLRKFIQRHGPKSRRISAPPVMPTTHEEDEDEAEAFLAVQTDSTDAAQESSSGPQTPSPQYTQAIARSVLQVHGDESSGQLDTEKLDPHFARLLSSLTLSAGGNTPNGADSKKPVVDPLVSASSLNTKDPAPPAFRPTLSTDPLSAFSSAATSNPLTNQSSIIGSSIPAVSSDHSASNSPHTPIQATSLLQPSSYGMTSTPTETLVSPRPSSASATSPLSPRARGPGPRRTASSAGISPYLSKPTEIPTSAKRLRELALLESIADESARMTPLLREREGGRSSLNGASSGPSNFLATNDLRVIYSSQPVAGPAMSLTPATPLIPSTMPAVNLGTASTQMRPHTSHTYHRNGSYSSSASTSMNQDQLLALMNCGGSLTSPSFSNPYGTTFPSTSAMPVAINPDQPFSQIPYSTASLPTPVGFVAPFLPPQGGFNPGFRFAGPPPAVTNNKNQSAQLLSILNAPQST